MGDFIDRPSATPTNPSMIHLLSRHKDILYDYTKEFRRVKVRIHVGWFTSDTHTQRLYRAISRQQEIKPI